MPTAKKGVRVEAVHAATDSRAAVGEGARRHSKYRHCQPIRGLPMAVMSDGIVAETLGASAWDRHDLVATDEAALDALVGEGAVGRAGDHAEKAIATGANKLNTFVGKSRIGALGPGPQATAAKAWRAAAVGLWPMRLTEEAAAI